MSHFAELDANNKVLRVIVMDGEGAEGEAACAALLGGTWKQTSYTASIRGRYAGIGDKYEGQSDSFVRPITQSVAAPTGNGPV